MTDFESRYEGSDLEGLLEKHSKGELLEKTYTLLIAEPGTYQVESVIDATVKRGNQVVKLEGFNVPVSLQNGPTVEVWLQNPNFLIVSGTISTGTEITYTAKADIAKASDVVQGDWNETNTESKAFILNRTHYFSPYGFIEPLPASDSSVGTYISSLGEAFMLNGNVYNTSNVAGVEIVCSVSGPSVVVRADYIDGEGYKLYHVSGSPAVDISFCSAGKIFPISEGYLPETILRKNELGKVNGKSLLEGDVTLEISGINYDLNVKAVNHRGFSLEAPENTIPAYIMSKQKGFTYVEGDVAFTKDGVAVLLHDATIDRTSDGTGNLSDFEYQELLQFDFGSWFSEEYAGVRIPTFKEWILLCKNLGLHPYIELKSTDSYTQAQITQIVNEVASCGMKGKVTYISFSSTFLGYVKTADISARLGFLTSTLSSGNITTAKNLKLTTNEVFLDAKLSSLKASVVDSCVTNNIPLEVWTVNTEEEIIKMHSYISGVTSDSLVAGKVLYNNALIYVPPISTWVPTTAISLNWSNFTLTSFNQFTLVATVEPSNSSEEVVWKSSNTSVATVANGVVTPLAEGSCTITATSGDFSASCAIEVAFMKFDISTKLTGCQIESDNYTVVTGTSWTGEVIPNEGYSLKNASIQVIMGGVDITDTAYSNGIISIESVTGAVSINILCVAVPVYSITKTLLGCSSNKDIVSIGEGNPYNEVFTALEDYRLSGASVTITMGGTDISSMYNDGVLNIPEVTGDLVIKVLAVPIPVYSISRNLVNCSSDKTTTSIRDGESYTETFTANEGYTIRGGNIVITMGGADISSSLSYSGVLNIESVTGNIVINVEAVEYNAAQPIVELDLLNVGSDGIIRNLGTGGSAYDATIQKVSSSDSFTVSNTAGLTLKNHAYANVPYGFKNTDVFTVICKAKLVTKSSKTYQRLFRAENDAPSWFYSKNNLKHQCKLSGKKTTESLITLISPLASTVATGNATILDVDTALAWEMMFTSDGTTIKFYLDGVLMSTQSADGLTESAFIGIGDNNPEAQYYASAIQIQRFAIYDSVITDSVVTEGPSKSILLTDQDFIQNSISATNAATGLGEIVSPYRVGGNLRVSTPATLDLEVSGGKTVQISLMTSPVVSTDKKIQIGIHTFGDAAIEAFNKGESLLPFLKDSGWLQDGATYTIPIMHKYAWIVASYTTTTEEIAPEDIGTVQIQEID